MTSHGEFFFVHKGDHLFTEKALIQLTRAYTSDCHFKTNVNEQVQKQSNKRNRFKTRDLLDKNKFDEIPQNNPVYKENRWYYD